MRQEFPTSVKRAALERSGGLCEAVGVRYGYQPGERCQRPVHARRVNYEHYPRGAHDPSPDTRLLSNCTAICPECNQYAANHTDKKVEAKIKRSRRKFGLDPDLRRPRPKLRSRSKFQRGRKFDSGKPRARDV